MRVLRKQLKNTFKSLFGLLSTNHDINNDSIYKGCPLGDPDYCVRKLTPRQKSLAADVAYDGWRETRNSSILLTDLASEYKDYVLSNVIELLHIVSTKAYRGWDKDRRNNFRERNKTGPLDIDAKITIRITDGKITANLTDKNSGYTIDESMDIRSVDEYWFKVYFIDDTSL